MAVEPEKSPLVPKALKIGRELRGLTQTELARQSGVARQHIVNLESGVTLKPSEMTLAALAAALELPVGFLARTPAEPPPLEVLHFRGKARVTNRISAQLLAQASLWADFTDALASRCARLPADAFARPTNTDDIEEIAGKVRVAWGLREDTPIQNVTRLLERSGAFIGTFDGGEKGVDAFSWIPQSPQILCNAERGMPSRVRFSLLHEAGHLVMHRGRVTGDEESEGEANRFASALLLPRRAFWQEFPRSGSRLNWDGMFRMKARWGASVQAIVHRAHQLGLINAIEYRRAFMFIAAQGWKKTEPNEPPDAERPELVPRIMESLAKAQGLTPQALCKELEVSIPLLSTMAGTDVRAFEQKAHTVFLFGAEPDQTRP